MRLRGGRRGIDECELGVERNPTAEAMGPGQAASGCQKPEHPLPINDWYDRVHAKSAHVAITYILQRLLDPLHLL